jgi:hypothetical protein
LEGLTIRRSYLARRLRELGIQLPEKTVKRLYEVVRDYDDLLRVKVDGETVTVAVKRFNHGSGGRMVARDRVYLISTSLGGSEHEALRQGRHRDGLPQMWEAPLL